MKLSSSIISFVLICVSWALPQLAFASTVYIEPTSPNAYVGQSLRVDVLIDADQGVNTIGGEVVFSKELFEVADIETGDSVINFWVEAPHVGKDAASVAFSGITPGGVSGVKKKVLTLVLTPRAPGEGSISLRNTKLYIGDGSGREVEPVVLPVRVSVSPRNGSSQADIVSDTTPPENFEVYFGRDDSLFEGKEFLVFATQDKGVGVDHYSVREGKWGLYTQTSSPYLLKGKYLREAIFVKAVDKNGNERVVVVPPEHPGFVNEIYEARFVILMVVLAWVLVRNIYLWQKHSSRS